MITRSGKIARLPKQVRHDLNSRLEDGAPGKQLVDWLNGLPEVQEVLQLRFGRRPISEQEPLRVETGRLSGLAQTSIESNSIKPNQTRSNQIKPHRPPRQPLRRLPQSRAKVTKAKPTESVF